MLPWNGVFQNFVNPPTHKKMGMPLQTTATGAVTCWFSLNHDTRKGALKNGGPRSDTLGQADEGIATISGGRILKLKNA